MPPKAATPFALELDRRVTEGALGVLYEKLDDHQVRCVACAHRCLIKEGLRGICKVRSNQGGVLMVPHGYVGALQCDPIEKKPFFHAYPGSDALTFGMLGCDLHCGYCQNHLTSQALRDPDALAEPMDCTPAQLIDAARRQGARVVATSYNEPLITSEWAVEVFTAARSQGFATAYISNGNATREVLEYIRPLTDLYKIDLKSMRDKNYRLLGGKLENILNGIGMVHAMGFWLEIVTLIIPGFNDSDDELREAAGFLHDLSPHIPWHVTAFHKDYKMQDSDNTTPAALLRAAAIGEAAGLEFVYAGNLPGRVGRYEDTRCPGCGRTLIRRVGYRILEDRLFGRGRCDRCEQPIPGVWGQD
ncbi:MAG: AmmeMemoRadiSam system radical SAM enzyme [Candidatus Dormibacteraeota bacterium]|nr:AmmeMemoRadiSam system radical SAM enzyme [Candidatus Dormibacteraeota bacterium]